MTYIYTVTCTNTATGFKLTVAATNFEKAANLIRDTFANLKEPDMVYIVGRDVPAFTVIRKSYTPEDRKQNLIKLLNSQR